MVPGPRKNPNQKYWGLEKWSEYTGETKIFLTIISFADKETEKIFKGEVSRKLPIPIQKIARRKIVYLDEAEDLNDLSAPPGNRLEKLSGYRSGQFSIRINDQWRVCFVWEAGQAKAVEIVNYH